MTDPNVSDRGKLMREASDVAETLSNEGRDWQALIVRALANALSAATGNGGAPKRGRPRKGGKR